MPELVEHLRKSRLLLYYSFGIRLISKSFPLDQQLLISSAAADLIIGNNSYAQLTSKTRQLSVVSAALNDNENLVLLNQEKHIVWQRFDTPSDILLPGQSFSTLQTLRAASKNCVSSHYTLLMSASCQLQLRWESHVTYWASGSLSSSNLIAFITSDGALQLRDQNLKPVWSLSGQDHNDSINYRFLRLDVDAAGMFVVFILVQLALGFWFYRRRISVRKKAAFALTSPNSNGLIVLSFSEIKELTKNFKYQIGPKMFKGVLPNRKQVAIKDVDASVEERKYRGVVTKIEAKVTEFGLGNIVSEVSCSSCSSAGRDVEDFGMVRWC
ncbi:hypothetical protein ACFX2H_014144 [Malus domestica]|uniref:Bulb-type lectin domain-containing protein n=1 Tax=Malus domestica TaxID=3750 RepID=A0A498I438_MALDO|nr:hypothetical protein DVH24_019565 [Malus domestica]